MKYYLTIKENELLRHTAAWVLSKRSQTKGRKNTSWMIPCIQKFLKDKLIYRNRKQIRKEVEEKDYKGTRAKFGDDGSVHYLDRGDHFMGAYIKSKLNMLFSVLYYMPMISQ